MTIMKDLYQEFKQYFNISIVKINNEYLSADAIYINDQLIVSTYEFEVADITSYIDCKDMFVNNVTYFYLLNKDMLTPNELIFIDIYYKYMACEILQKLCQKFPNVKYNSYLLLQQL